MASVRTTNSAEVGTGIPRHGDISRRSLSSPTIRTDTLAANRPRADSRQGLVPIPPLRTMGPRMDRPCSRLVAVEPVLPASLRLRFAQVGLDEDGAPASPHGLDLAPDVPHEDLVAPVACGRV